MMMFRFMYLGAVLACGGLFFSEASAVEIVAHRGASYDAPENTVASWKLGFEQRADAGELDIYLTKDGQIVVMHDATTKRTGGKDGRIAAQTLEQLRQLDVGQWKSPAWTGTRIPTLAEALATVPEGKRMLVEIKCGPEVLPELKRVLDQSGKRREQIVLISFDYATLRQAKRELPQYETYWLSSYKADKKSGKFPAVDDMIPRAREAGFEGLGLQQEFPVDSAMVKKLAAAKLKVAVWTVDDPAIARRLVAAGVPTLITNRPGWLREQLEMNAQR
jgi:glycerophosphoryl diester phosphodiesterase